jgi:hypothetical protein
MMDDREAEIVPSIQDALDVICSPESNYLHQDIQCDNCKEAIVGVRFRCCRCEDFDLCSQCKSGGCEKKHNLEHSFYEINYHRLDLPPPDGKDFELLQRFERGSTSDSFYLHYPWFFGAPIFERLISETPNEDEFRKLLTQLQESLEDVQLQLALDGITRSHASEDWNWGQVQKFTRPLIDLQLIRAEYSGLFHQLYTAMKERINLTETASHDNATTVLDLRRQLFTADLQSASVLKCKDAMHTFLAARLNRDGFVEVPRAMNNISESARYIEMLSKNFDLRVSSLPIFEEVQALLRRRKPGSPDVEWSISKSVQRWQEYMSAYGQLVACMDRYLHQCTDSVPSVLNDPSRTAPPSESPATSLLASLTQVTLCKDFEAGFDIVSQLDDGNPLHVIEIIYFHDIRGDISEAWRVAHSAVRRFPAKAQSPTEFVFHDLFKLCEAYFGCFTEGRWTHAILRATTTLEELLSLVGLQLTHENSLLACTLEIFCFKILFLAAKDRNDPLQLEFVSHCAERLRHLRHFVTQCELHTLSLYVLDMELRVRQEEETIFELEQTEFLHHRKVFVPQPEHALKTFSDFLLMLPEKSAENSDDMRAIGMKASTRLHLGYVLVESQLDDSYTDELRDILRQAWTLFNKCGSLLGQSEIALLSLRYHIDLDVKDFPGWNDIETCLQAHRHFKGLLKFHEFKAAVKLQDTFGGRLSRPFLATGPSVSQHLLPIAKDAGDELMFRVSQIRSMQSWMEGPTFIMLCENVFHPNEGFLSDQLFLEASKLLCQIYEINNNFTESSAFALLHLRLAHARHDRILLDHATMLHFRCVGNMVSSTTRENRMYEIASLAFSFDRVIARFCKSVLAQMEEGPDFTISAGSLPIESLLWPAQLVAHIVEDDGNQMMSPEVTRAVHRSLKLAVDFLAALPERYHGLFFSEVCQALGTAAEMLTNPILSLLCYDLGQSRSANSDGYKQNVLRLKTGRRMAVWIEYDRASFKDIQDIAFAYLKQALHFFWGEGSRQYSYRNGLEASLVTARAHLREVQYLMEDLDWGEDTRVTDEVKANEQHTNKRKLLDHVEAGLSAVRIAISGNLALRRRLKDLPAMQALENSRLFYFGDMEELYWNHMGLEMSRSLLTEEPGPLLVAMQEWKAVSLQDTLSQRLEQGVRVSDLTLGIQDETTAGAPGIPTALDPGLKPHSFQEESIWSMAEVAEPHLEPGQRIIFVDWTRYYDTLFMICYDGTEGRIRKGVVEMDYHRIEDWVRCELGVSSLHQGHIPRKRLHKFAPLKKLTPIFDHLEGFVKPKDLLVLVPTGILHALPLQAIPFGSQGKPLIASNPVVFCPSLSLLETCVDRVERSAVLDSINAAAFTRLGPGDVEEERRMYSTAKEGLADRLLRTSFASGTEVTRTLFMDRSRNARLLHYHGHAYLEATQRRDRALQLEPQLASVDMVPDDGLLSVMDIFNLQLDAAVVVLLACASGEDDVAPNDDLLGLLSAFLYAGASSVITTRWPTQTSDAREFAKIFYKSAFTSRKCGIVNLAVAFQAAVLELWEEWDEDDPYHWAQFQLYGSWFGKI